MRLDDAIRTSTLINEQPTDLYRYYDDAGVLLYVGVSKSAVLRAMQHSRDAAWWPDWVTMRRQVFATRGAALRAERQAIMDERPRWNVTHATTVAIDLGRML